MDKGVKGSIQFPDDDEFDDCPEADDCNNDQVPPARVEDKDDRSFAGSTTTAKPPVIANGHTESLSCSGSSAVVTGGNDRSPQVVLFCSEDEESSEDGEDDDEEEDASGMGVGKGEGTGDAWKLEDGESITCECFVCDHATSGYEAADLMRAHIESFHDFSFTKLRTKFQLDYPGFVQFVRWAREMKSAGTAESSLASIWMLTGSGDLPWSSDKYLLPPSEGPTCAAFPVDYFLTLDFFATEDKQTEAQAGGVVLEDLVSEIERLQVDKERMTAVFQRIVAGSLEDGDKTKQSSSSLKNMSPCKRSAKKSSPKHISPNMLEDESNNHNKMYFESYDELSIHHDMIFDHSRTEAYRDAIIDRAEDIQGKVVMDLGCGSGILSMFCAQQGASTVHAIDKSNIIFDAMSNSFENNFDKIIKFHHKDLDNDDTSDLEKDGQVDVLVSEFMGYFLFFEGMTESFIRARKRFLKPDGVLMPDTCTIELAPIGPSGIYKRKVNCWDQVYGFKMPALKQRAIKEPLIDLVKPDEIIGNRVPVKFLDLRTCNVSDVYIDEQFEFEFNYDTEFCGVAGFFSVDFTGPERTITLPTSPWDTPTHWKQTIFFFPSPIKVAKGEKMSGAIRSCNHKDDPRWLVVLLTFGNDKKFFYEIK